MIEVEYLDAETVIEINRVHCGADVGVDRAGVEAAVARAWSGFGDVEIYPTLWAKAAVYLHGLATTQYFLDGNKRTAWLAAGAFLRLNDEDLAEIPDDEAEDFILEMIAGEHDLPAVADWLFVHAMPLPEALADVGLCDFCDREGELPGAELDVRNVHRRASNRDADILQEFTQGDNFTVGTRPFRWDRDLVPGVCARCREGWMRLVDREGWQTLAAIEQNVELPLFGDWRRKLAVYLVKSALLRSALEPGVSGSWRRRHARRLREYGRVPRGWTVWALDLDEKVEHVGSFTFGVSADANGEPLARPDEPTVVQWTRYAAGCIFFVLYDDPNAEAPLSFVALDQAGARPVDIWPTLQEPLPSAEPVDFAMARNFETALGDYFRRVGTYPRHDSGTPQEGPPAAE